MCLEMIKQCDQQHEFINKNNKNQMKKKSQIRKYTVEKVEEAAKTEQIPEMLKLYAQHVKEKKMKLVAKKKELEAELNQNRKKSEKLVFQMVDNVKDRLEKKQRVVMDASSRPTKDDVKSMSDLFAYMSNQSELISKNSEKINQLSIMLSQKNQAINFPICDYTQLDQQFVQLQHQCSIEEVERDRLIEERNKNLQFYKTINETIGEYRVKYEQVEALIQERQKQLDHLILYFQTRQREDQQKIDRENTVSSLLENELLKAQEIVNFNKNKNIELEIMEIEFADSKKNRVEE